MNTVPFENIPVVMKSLSFGENKQNPNSVLDRAAEPFDTED